MRRAIDDVCIEQGKLTSWERPCERSELPENYEKTIIGVPDRSHAWIMARTSELPDGEYERLVNELERLGYDLTGLREVPQRWSQIGGAAPHPSGLTAASLCTPTAGFGGAIPSIPG